MSRRQANRRGARGGGVGAWSPLRLPVVLWVDSRDSLAYDGSNRISSWPSRVNGYALTSAGVDRPLYVASDAGYGGKPTVHIDGAAISILTSSISPTFSPPFSYYEYSGKTSTGANYASIANGSGHSVVPLRNVATTETYWADGGGATQSPAVSDPDATKRSFYMGVAADETVTLVIGNSTTASGVNARVSTAYNAVRLGYPSSANQRKIGAVLLFSRELTAAERTLLHNYYTAVFA